MKLIALICVAALAWAAGEYSNRRAPGFSLADSQFQQHDPPRIIGVKCCFSISW